MIHPEDIQAIRTALGGFPPQGTSQSDREMLERVTRRSLEEVKHLTEYEDEKANRILTAIAFLSAFAGLTYAATVPRTTQGVMLHNGWALVYHFLFVLFALFVVLGAALVVLAVRPWFNIPPHKVPDSVLFFPGILKRGAPGWPLRFSDADLAEIQANYINDSILETYLVADKIQDKMKKLSLGVNLLLISILVLGVWYLDIFVNWFFTK